MVAEAKRLDLEARPLNGRMWQPGESGNRHGRPVGARGRFSERFVADLTTAWEQYGETALAETAKLLPPEGWPRQARFGSGDYPAAHAACRAAAA
jgi:hypothetical protein